MSRQNTPEQKILAQQRRSAGMRAYARALTEIGNRYPDERRRLRTRFLAFGLTPNAAFQKALAMLRAEHPEEFSLLYDEKKTDGDAR